MRIPKRLKIRNSSENVYFITPFYSLKTPFQYNFIQLKYLMIPLIVNILNIIISLIKIYCGHFRKIVNILN